jgi:hypothetical protein
MTDTKMLNTINNKLIGNDEALIVFKHRGKWCVHHINTDTQEPINVSITDRLRDSMAEVLATL